MSFYKMERQQALISLSMTLIVCLLGIPIWWHTTKAYRARIPYKQLFLLAGSPMPKLNSKWEIFVETDILKTSSASIITEFTSRIKEETVKEFLDFETNITVVQFHPSATVKESVSTFNGLPAQVLQLDSELLSQSLEKQRGQDKNDLHYTIVVMKAPVEFRKRKDKCQILVGKSHIILLVDNGTIQHLMQCAEEMMNCFKDMFYPKKNMSVNATNNNDRKATSSQASAGYQILFSLAVANPHEIILTWDIDNAVENQLRPFLNELAFLGPYSISSQVLNFVDLGINPTKSKNGYYYSKMQLPLLLNPLESRLNAYTSNKPILNFVLYTPPLSVMPLSFKTGNKTDVSFTSPRWGGVILNNIEFFNKARSSFSTMPTSTSLKLRMENEMRLFIGQLRELIGLKRGKSSGLIFSPFDHSVVMKWEISYLLISKSFENLEKTISTLTSLANLLEQIANIIIRDDIMELIVMAVKEVHNTKTFLQNGNLMKAFLASKHAFHCSEKAFFDHSLLALLYFPDDQKYAIYLPLFLPMCVPIFLSVLGAIKFVKLSKPKTE